jgi:hypothetical protein
MTSVDAVRRRHEDRLLRFPHVTGVGTGVDPRTGTDVIVVYVTAKVPPADLRPDEMLPERLENVPVHVLAIGDVTAQGPA